MLGKFKEQMCPFVSHLDKGNFAHFKLGCRARNTKLGFDPYLYAISWFCSANKSHESTYSSPSVGHQLEYVGTVHGIYLPTISLSAEKEH